MKVICIDDKPHSNSNKWIQLLKEGETYHVRKEVIADGADGNEQVAYDLVEFGFPYAFGKNRFIPLSNIDEMELLEQRQNELLTQ